MIERLARMSVREQALIGGFALLVLGFIFYAAIVEPHLVLLHSSSAKIWGQEHLLMVRRQHLSEQSMRNREHSRLMDQVEAQSARFMTPAEASGFLAELSVLSESAGTRLVKVDFLEEKELYPVPLVCNHRVPDVLSSGGSDAEQQEVHAVARNPVKKRVRLTLRGRCDNIMRLLEMIKLRTTKVHVGELVMEVVSEESADLNAGFVLTLFTLNTTDEEES
jgi:hypothetical protein